MIAKQQMMSVEQVLLLLTTVIMGVRESVISHCDKPIAQKILIETQAVYDLATSTD